MRDSAILIESLHTAMIVFGVHDSCHFVCKYNGVSSRYIFELMLVGQRESSSQLRYVPEYLSRVYGASSAACHLVARTPACS